jgi:hypothetical protein
MLAVQKRNPVPSVDASNDETASGFIRDATLARKLITPKDALNTEVIKPS